MNIPNILSIFRIVLVPVFISVSLSGGENASIYAAGIFVLSGLTDWLDGLIARRFNMITRLGQILDPLADKLMQAAVFYCLWARSVIPGLFFVAFVIKEIVMVGGGVFLLKTKKTVIPSKWYGKAATILFYLVAFVVLAFGKMLQYNVQLILMSSSLAITMFSLVMYTINFIRTFIRRRPDEDMAGELGMNPDRLATGTGVADRKGESELT